MANFRDAVDAMPLPSVTEVPPLLITHVTDWHRGVPVLESGIIEPPEECPVYKEHLVYAFYGRAAYVPNGSEEVVVDMPYAPVAFIMRPDVAPPRRLLPFDSGGLERYRPQVHPKSARADFELSPSVDSARRLIKGVYGDNRAYFRGRVMPGLTIDPLHTTLLAYCQLVSTNTKADERKSAIEFQFSSPLTISGHVEAIYLPEEALESASVQALVADLNATPIPYWLPTTYHPYEFRQALRTQLEALLRSKGAIA